MTRHLIENFGIQLSPSGILFALMFLASISINLYLIYRYFKNKKKPTTAYYAHNPYLRDANIETRSGKQI
ncbi:MAG: hypothetical protein HQM16_12950 [Deltaproteobacteria bacterium]|nr:hypothetical protein [Deltaproteobacteria bacterium]